MKHVADENPTAMPPIQMKRKKKNAQAKDVTPRAIEGIRRCIASPILLAPSRVPMRLRGCSCTTSRSERGLCPCSSTARCNVSEGGPWGKPKVSPGTKSSPSRWRFRPPNLVTFRFRVRSPGSDSTYSRSVLGARGKLRAGAAGRKAVAAEVGAICEHFCVRSPNRRFVLHALKRRDQRFAGPVALSSTLPTDVPLPRTRPSAGLRPTRAPWPAQGEGTAPDTALQDSARAQNALFARAGISTFPRPFYPVGDNSVE